MTRTFVSPPASPAARGRAFGEAHPNEIANTVGGYCELFDRLAGSHVDVEALGTEAMAIIRTFSPDAGAEIEGIAAGAALPVWAVAALNARTEILARCRYQSRGECSTVVAVGDEDTPMLA